MGGRHLMSVEISYVKKTHFFWADINFEVLRNSYIFRFLNRLKFQHVEQ